MEIKNSSYASFYINPSPLNGPLEYIKGLSMRGRLACLSGFLKKLLILPFALAFKIAKSFFKTSKVVFTLFSVIFSFGLSSDARWDLSEKMAVLGKDIADWILFPFGLLVFAARHLLGFLIHPKFNFGF